MNEVGQFATLIDLITGRHDTFREWTWPTGENANLRHLQITEENITTLLRKAGKAPFDTHIRMLLLYKFEKTRHIWTSEVIDGLQTCEHRCFRQSLEVILADVLQRKAEKLIL